MKDDQYININYTPEELDQLLNTVPKASISRMNRTINEESNTRSNLFEPTNYTKEELDEMLTEANDLSQPFQPYQLSQPIPREISQAQSKKTGVKLDTGKPLAHLILSDFASALNEVIKVGTAGATKYTPHGWKEVENGFERYSNAMMRHYLKETTEGLYDPELTEMTGEPIHHATCVAWNALARLHFLIEKQESKK